MKKLTGRMKWGYAIADMGGNMFITVTGFYLLFYLTDVVIIAPAWAGMCVLIGKMWGAVTDTLIGYISDITKTRFGRRRPYIFVGSIVSFVSMGLMFTKPSLADNFDLFVYYTLIYCLLNTAFSLINVPYTAMLPDLTKNYDKRTTMVGYRMSLAVIGTFLGSATVIPIVNHFQPELLGWKVTGYIEGAILLITSLITFFAIKEPGKVQASKIKGFIENLDLALSNKVFLLALAPWALISFSIALLQGALVYFFRFLYHNDNVFQYALLFLLSTTLIFIPVWVKVSKNISKKLCYSIGTAILMCAIIIFYFVGENIGMIGTYLIMGIAGIGLSTHYIMPYSILPDVIEHDSILFKTARRGGVLTGLWTFSSKVGQAIATIIIGSVLTFFGYVAGNEPSENTFVIIKILCGLGPAIFLFLGIIVLYFFPIDKEYYLKMISENEEK